MIKISCQTLFKDDSDNDVCNSDEVDYNNNNNNRYDDDYDTGTNVINSEK